MGSLMAGWNSHARHLQYDRNRSMTKEEIASFQRSKKMEEEEERFFLKSSYRLSKEDKRDEQHEGSEFIRPREEDSTEPLLKKHGWWICSKWAFLNEQPMMSWETSYSYVAQFHIARKHNDE
ncbi:hypothetical protein HanPSC8_Chr16g0697361 [Helianthus annuus]|nr:hypothetical protein HanPSC8_Chr16g0697361 [Helianthus annuus]